MRIIPASKRVLHEARIEVGAPYDPAFRPSEQITVPKKKIAHSGDKRSRCGKDGRKKLSYFSAVSSASVSHLSFLRNSARNDRGVNRRNIAQALHMATATLAPVEPPAIRMLG